MSFPIEFIKSMKKIVKIAITVSILIITSYAYTDDNSVVFNNNIQRYYGGGQNSARSYIDMNDQISTRSYTHPNTYPNNYPDGDDKDYNASKNPTLRYFQPADGSLSNGSYDAINKTAKTSLHNYTDVIMINGTYTTPTLHKNGMYVDSQGKEHFMIGSLLIPSEDESDIFTYYLFGQPADQKDNQDASKKNKVNKPLQNFNSQNE